jgi:6-phosphogluconolactonase
MERDTMNILQFADAKDQALALAEQIAEDIKAVLSEKDIATICVPGGTTPVLFFNYLRKIPLDWQRVRVVLTDERWVGLEDPMSNEALLKRELQAEDASVVKLVSFFKEGVSVVQAVEELNQNQSDWLPIDICILGMGEDGHTASLFPLMNKLTESLNKHAKPEIALAKVIDKEELRVTLNLPALLTARSHYLLIKGHIKKQVLTEANIRPTVNLPISYLLSAVPIAAYYCDI